MVDDASGVFSEVLFLFSICLVNFKFYFFFNLVLFACELNFKFPLLVESQPVCSFGFSFVSCFEVRHRGLELKADSVIE